MSKLWGFHAVSHQNTDGLCSICVLGVESAMIMVARSKA